MGEINPAFTAASPKTKAPKILKEVPRLFGVLASPSYNSSNVNKRINASIITGNGTLLLCIEKFINKFTGRISGSYDVNAIKKAGSNNSQNKCKKSNNSHEC